MATNPNGPSLNDLMYSSYNQDGFLNVTQNTFSPQIGQIFGPGSGLSDNMAVTEKVTILLPGLTSNWNVEDFVTTSENVMVVLPLNNNVFSLTVSDTVTTTEAVTRA